MPHCVVPAAEEILDREFPVLDKGFVRLVDYLGGDARIVQAARVSYGAGTKSFREDSALIDNLLRQEHTSPFEQVVLTFHVKLPIFVARQWIRHRTARVNEISGRYSVMKDDFYVPEAGAIAMQSADNKQGRAPEALPEGQARSYISRMEAGQRAAYEEYSGLIEAGLARELARIDLPLSLYTEWYWQIDLHNLFRFIQLRLDPHAQFEIREYARVLLDITRAVAPAACGSFENHVLGGTRFSAEEMGELRRRLEGGSGAPPGLEGRKLSRFEEKLRSGRQL
jgi:thymidylate synthase (FAD)